VQWKPMASQGGAHGVTLAVSDGRGGTAQQAYSINVGPAPGDHAPTIFSQPVTTIFSRVGVTFAYQVKAIDPDNDQLSYSLTTLPQGMTINASTGLVSWTLTQAIIGTQNVTV